MSFSHATSRPTWEHSNASTGRARPPSSGQAHVLQTPWGTALDARAPCATSAPPSRYRADPPATSVPQGAEYRVPDVSRTHNHFHNVEAAKGPLQREPMKVSSSRINEGHLSGHHVAGPAVTSVANPARPESVPAAGGWAGPAPVSRRGATSERISDSHSIFFGPAGTKQQEAPRTGRRLLDPPPSAASNGGPVRATWAGYTSASWFVTLRMHRTVYADSRWTPRGKNDSSHTAAAFAGATSGATDQADSASVPLGAAARQMRRLVPPSTAHAAGGADHASLHSTLRELDAVRRRLAGAATAQNSAGAAGAPRAAASRPSSAGPTRAAAAAGQHGGSSGAAASVAPTVFAFHPHVRPSSAGAVRRDGAAHARPAAASAFGGSSATAGAAPTDATAAAAATSGQASAPPPPRVRPNSAPPRRIFPGAATAGNTGPTNALHRAQQRQARHRQALESTSMDEHDNVEASPVESSEDAARVPLSAQMPPQTSAFAARPGAAPRRPMSALYGSAANLRRVHSFGGTYRAYPHDDQQTGQPPGPRWVRPSSAGAARAPSSGAAQPSSTSAYFPSSYNHGTDQDAASAQASAPVPVTPPQPKALSPEAQALREQGNVLFQSKRYADAADAYDRALRLEPSNELLLCNRAAALLLLHRYAAAMRDSQRAAQLDPALVKAHWRAAKAALFLGAGDSARRHYSEAQRLAASQPDAESIAAELRMVDVAERARRSLDHREWAEALRCCEQLLRVFPPSSPCAAVWRCLQVEATVATDAARALELAVATSDGDPLCSEAWYQRARCVFYTAHDANATASALGFLRRCREQEPEMGAKAGALQAMIEAFARLRDEGNAAYAAGRWAEAHAAYTRCLGVDAHNGSLRAIILCNRAAVHIQRDAWGDALDDIDASIRLNPTNAKAYTRRARVQQHFGRHEAVVRDLQTALRLFPSPENQERLSQAMAARSDATGGGTGRAQTRPSSAHGPRTAGPNGAAGYSTRPSSAGPSGRAVPPPQPAPRPAGPTLYEVLGVERGCEERQVVRAYREAALRWHPDKWATAGEGERKEAEAKFKQIADAYNTLRDPQRRYQYDAQFVQQSATIRRTSTYTYA